MANTATRLITLIMLLQRRPNQKAAALAEELGVSVRTIHRYIAMLDDMGIPVYSERGPHGGFSLVRGYRMPPLVFTPEEAVAVYLGTSLVREVWGEMYRDPAQGALSKLDNVLPDEQRNEVAWARRTLLTTGMHRADDALLVPLLVELRSAARERRRVRMLYRGRGRPEALQRDLDPYVLVHRWGWWYIVGYCHLREAMRTFRVDRIAELERLDQTFEAPDGFDVHKYLAEEAESQRGVHVSLRFPPEASIMALDDRYFWETVEEQPDGSVIVTQAFPDLASAARTALSYGPYAMVLEPEELRCLVSERARAIAAQYRRLGQNTTQGGDEMTEREEIGSVLAAYCGLYCGACAIKNGQIRDAATTLQRMLKAYDYAEWAPEAAEFVPATKHYPEFDGVLDWLTTQDCPGCLDDGGNPMCTIRICAREKELPGCWDCAEVTCEKLQEIDRGYPGAKENRQRIREVGPQAWLDEQAAKVDGGFSYLDERHGNE